jgi:hypothetical protein
MLRDFKNAVKKCLYGGVPYIATRLLSPHSPKLPYLKYQMLKGYTHYPYDFAEEYLNADVEVQTDAECGLPYVMHRGEKRLYFPRKMSAAAVTTLYKSLLIEQDARHAHHYVESLSEFRGRTLLDVGAAEGILSLEAIEAVKKVYLFECDEDWIEALEATFAPWRQKVSIVHKFVGNSVSEEFTTIDAFLADKSHSNLFLKMDIEGAECSALEGAAGLFSEPTDLEFAICIYHRRNDRRQISEFLSAHGCTFEVKPGYFYSKHRLRPAVVRGRHGD